MAVVFIEGFDKYGAVDSSASGAYTFMNQLFGEWTAKDSNVTLHIIAPLSLHGNAIQISNNSGNSNFGLHKNIPSIGRSIGGCRFTANLAGGVSAGIIAYLHGGTFMCTVAVSQSGFIQMVQQGANGTVIATSLVAIGSFVVHYIEWDITFGASSSFTIWLDGVQILTGSGNTGNGQTTADNFILGCQPNSNTVMQFDDLYIFDSTGATNNAVLRTNPVVDTEYPTSDFSVAWSFGATTQGYPYSLTSNIYNAGGSNTLYLFSITPPANCTIISVSIMCGTNNTNANVKSCLYSDSSNTPNTLIATGANVLGVSNGVACTSVFSSGQSLTGSTKYWIGFITDSNSAWYQADGTSNLGVQHSNTFGSGPPGTAPAMTTGQPTLTMWANVTSWSGTNKDIVNRNPMAQPIGSNLQYLTSSTVSQEDLYGFAALQSTPTNIYCTSVKASMELTDAGARTIDLRTKSSSADTAGNNAGQTPAQSFQWISSYWETDPNTSGAWTQTNLNNATSGVKVAS